MPTRMDLKIREALPSLFEVAYPVIDPKVEMLSALSLLRFEEIDALPLSFDPDGKHRVVAGFSSLARLMRLDPKGLQSFLKRPCEEASEPLASVDAESSLSVLLDKFLETRFGFARVNERNRVGALARLRDLLALYDSERFETRLTVEDVASPIFALPPETSVREALEQMFDRRCRRVFLSGTKKFVWDRGIIERLFSPAVLALAVKNPSKDFLGPPLSEFEGMTATEVKPRTELREAARVMRLMRGQCLTINDGVVTPWDLVMKPWKEKKLRIN